MKVPISIKINIDVKNYLNDLNINISKYINDLIIFDLTKSSLKNPNLKNIINLAIKDEKKILIIKELKLIGAINNISKRIEYMSKCNELVFHILLKKNIELLEIEFNFDYSADTKFIIKSAHYELQQEIKKIEPYIKIKKLK